MPEVIIILLGIMIAVYYFVRRSQRKKTKIVLQPKPIAKNGTEKPQVTIEEVARSQHAAQVSNMPIPIDGVADEDIKRVQGIMAASAAKGQNPRHIYGQVAAALPSFQWADFDTWVKKFRQSGAWPDMWEDVEEYYNAKDNGEIADDQALHNAKSALLAHTQMAVAVEIDKLKDWQKWGTKMVEIGTTPDSCSWCAKYTGKKMRISTLIKKQIPPIHPGCRCSVLPADD